MAVKQQLNETKISGLQSRSVSKMENSSNPFDWGESITGLGNKKLKSISDRQRPGYQERVKER